MRNLLWKDCGTEHVTRVTLQFTVDFAYAISIDPGFCNEKAYLSYFPPQLPPVKVTDALVSGKEQL